MKELLKRSVTALIFAGVVVGLVYYSFYSFLLLLLIIVIGGVYEMIHLFNLAKFSVNKNYLWIKIVLSILFISYSCFEYDTIRFYVFLLLSVIMMVEFLLRDHFTQAVAEFFVAMYFSVFFVASLDVFYFHAQKHYLYDYVLLIIFMIWANDTFAYLTGKLLGKHKLMPEVSPKKSVEGFVGGIIFSLLTAILYFQYVLSEYTIWSWMDTIIIAIIVSTFGTMGDLIESKFKRLAGVKDSGKILPGHGGILDRFDAWYLSIPVIDLFLYLKNFLW